MRRRLLGAIVGLVAAALLLLAVPLGVAVRAGLVDRALDGLEGQVQQLATFLEVRARTCGEVRLWLQVAAGEGVELAAYGPDGVLRFAAGTQAPAPPGPEVAAALEGLAGRQRADGQLAVAVPLSTRVCGSPLVLRGAISDASLTASIRRSLLAIGGSGLAILLVAIAAGRWTGRRLSAPFEALAVAARSLGHGDFSARAPRSGLPEADQIAAALDTTADRLGRATQRGAAFTADASHQLRTPLTALQLHLDVLAAEGATPATVAAAQAEADRLDATIEELVALTRLEAAAEEVDVGALAAERVAAWRLRAERDGRTLTLERAELPPLRLRPAAVGQALQVLLDNALVHGDGEIVVRVTPTVPSATTRGVQVCVHDQGPGFDPAGVLHPTSRDRGAGPGASGHGLALARSLVEGEGGRLLLDSGPDGTRACLVLPGS